MTRTQIFVTEKGKTLGYDEEERTVSMLSGTRDKKKRVSTNAVRSFSNTAGNSIVCDLVMPLSHCARVIKVPVS